VSERREFLGWDAPLLPRAANWLLQRFGADQSAVVVALPGSRATRRLEALLVERAAARGLTEFSPPRLITVGHLGDELLLPQSPVAGRLLRTLLWCDALAGLTPDALGALFREPPASSDRSAWLAYAEELRSVHATLAAEGRDFADVVAALPAAFDAAREDPSARKEVERWRVLAGLQADYRARLAAAGRSDPHEGRWASLRADAFVPAFAGSPADSASMPAGSSAAAGRVVLVGVVEFNALTRALLERLGAAVTALVGAPPSEQAAFDEVGAADTATWYVRHLPLQRAAWCVVETPDDQAERAVAALDAWTQQDAALAGPDAALSARGPDVLCGVPDESVTPFLERRLAQRGVVARPGSAGPFRDSPAGTLLAALHDLLATGRFAALAALARHPAAHAALARHPALAGRDPLALLDAAQAAHLPGQVCGPGAPRTDWPELAPVLTALHALLGELLIGKPRAWSAWAEPIVEALSALFGDGTLLPEAQESHATHASLGVLAEALGELSALADTAPAARLQPAARAAVEAREALALLLRSCAANEVPPRADSAAVDLLGWLELPLDEAPDLVLTGFNAGALPAAPASARWLPEALRTALSIAGERERLARDACLLTHVLHSRARVALISGRVGSERDPLLPSPLAFQVPDDDIPARVAMWLPGQGGAQVAPGQASPRPAGGDARDTRPAARALPRLAVTPTLTGISVTGFKAYMDSPYGFYLERVLRLKRAEDDAHELDPMGFGTLAHAVLQAFGQGAARHAEDEDVVRAALHAALDVEVRARFGPRPQPAVLVQVEQLRHRLERFARRQAQSTRDGWRIAAVEWEPTAPVTLDLGDQSVVLRGRIDRIDVHADGRRWRVLDYKAGDKVDDPGKAHRMKDGTWLDLQLPLYALLVREFAAARALTEAPQLGYVALSREDETACARLVDWSDGDLEEGHDKARQVAAAILAGEFFVEPEDLLGDPILDAIAGKGLLETGEEDEAVDGEVVRASRDRGDDA